MSAAIAGLTTSAARVAPAMPNRFMDPPDRRAIVAHVAARGCCRDGTDNGNILTEWYSMPLALIERRYSAGATAAARARRPSAPATNAVMPSELIATMPP